MTTFVGIVWYIWLFCLFVIVTVGPVALFVVVIWALSGPRPVYIVRNPNGRP